MPLMASCSPGRSRLRYSDCASRLYRISATSVDLPDPLTPVMQTNSPSGIRTSMFFRLFSRAPFTSRALPLPCRRFAGIGMRRSPRRKAPVMLSGQARIASSGPWQTTWPPCSPAPGPRSTIQSAERMVSSSCSTTSTVLPRSRSRVSVAMSRRLSRWCRPMDGSSRMYSTPIRLLPICVARRMRCPSPPESDPAARSMVR